MPIDSYIHQHPYTCIGALWLFSNAVLYMPPPAPNGSGFYKWLFGVLHALAGAIPRVASNLLPAGSMIEKALSGGNGATNGSAPNSSTNAPNLSAPPKP